MLEVLLYVLGILIIFVGLIVSIGLHEVGHLVPAKLFGVKVTQYMVGFGKTLFSWRKGETEYGVKMIPLGGYIAMIGMYPPHKPGEVPRASTTGFLNTVVQEGAPARPVAGDPGTATLTSGPVDPDPAPGEPGGMDEPGARPGIGGLVDDARLASGETIAAGEEHRTFYSLSVWKKVVVMLGGPFMNLILAFVCFAIVLVGFGAPQNTTTLGAVNECLVSASSDATECTADAPAAPAAAAGLRPGDTVLAINGTRITGWDQLRGIVSDSPGQDLRFEIERDGATETVSVVPAANERAVVDAEGVAVEDDAGRIVTESVGMIGATPTAELVRQPITEVPVMVGDAAGRMVNVIIQLPQRMVGVWNAAFGSAERDPNGPLSVVGVGRIAGEVVSTDQVPVAERVQFVVGLLGNVNIALFIFNLVPLMPLDGGHVAGAVYEGLKRMWARLRRKPDPGPVDTAKMVPITFAVVVVLGAMTLLLIYADIVKPVSIFG